MFRRLLEEEIQFLSKLAKEGRIPGGDWENLEVRYYETTIGKHPRRVDDGPDFILAFVRYDKGGSSVLIGVTKRNANDVPNQERGRLIALKRAIAASNYLDFSK